MQGLRAGTAAGLLVLVAALPAALPAAAAPAMQFIWDAEGLTGDFAARVTFAFPTSTRCTLHFLTAGASDEFGLHHYYARDDVIGASGSVIGGAAVGAHVGPVTTAVVHEDGFLSAHSIFTSVYSGSATWVFAGFGLQPFPGAQIEGTFVVDFACDAPFEVVALEASREVVGASPDQLEQGAGAAVNNVPGAGASAVDGFARASTGPNTVFRFHLGSFTASFTDVVLVHPGGTEHRQFQAEGFMRVASGPGEYALLVNRAWTGYDHFVAFLAGFHPVASLDDWPDLPGF